MDFLRNKKNKKNTTWETKWGQLFCVREFGSKFDILQKASNATLWYCTYFISAKCSSLFWRRLQFFCGDGCHNKDIFWSAEKILQKIPRRKENFTSVNLVIFPQHPFHTESDRLCDLFIGENHRRILSIFTNGLSGLTPSGLTVNTPNATAEEQHPLMPIRYPPC